MDINSKRARWEPPILAAFLLFITLIAYDFEKETVKHVSDIIHPNHDHDRTLKKRQGGLDDDSQGNNVMDIFHNVAPSVVFIDTIEEVKADVNKEDDKKIYRNTDKWSKRSENDNSQNKKVDNMKRLQMAWRKKQNRLKKRQGMQDSATLPIGSGTGFVWDREGHIITNNHVVAGAKQIEVSILTKKDVDNENSKFYPTSNDGRTPGIDGEYHWRVVRAKVIGTDPGSDIAVIKIDAPGVDIHPVERGDDKDVMVGADCLAIGNPYGLDHTLSRGIISAKGRVSHSQSGIPITNLIQTDASMNSGNNGGPLLNSKGQVIGMTTLSSEGIGHAIPVSTISKVSEILLKKGKVARPNFGITFDMGVQAAMGIHKGLLISNVSDVSKKAGLIGTSMALDGSIQLGDIILSINGVHVDSDVKAYSIVDESLSGGGGSKLNVKILRRMKNKYVEKYVTVTLG